MLWRGAVGLLPVAFDLQGKYLTSAEPTSIISQMVYSQLTFGEHLRRLRRRKRWGLQDLARETGLSVSHLSRLENDNGVPNPDTVVKLAQALGADLEEMLELARCLPREILDRLIRRAGEQSPARLRTAGSEVGDPTFSRALVEDIDPALRASIANEFDLSSQDMEGIFRILRGMARLSPDERTVVIDLLARGLVERGQ